MNNGWLVGATLGMCIMAGSIILDYFVRLDLIVLIIGLVFGLIVFAISMERYFGS